MGLSSIAKKVVGKIESVAKKVSKVVGKVGKKDAIKKPLDLGEDKTEDDYSPMLLRRGDPRDT